MLVFGIVILIHELGHFTIARYNKVKVNEFSIGMGPLLFQKTVKETPYSLRLFPVGGYVAMEGEDEESDDENSFDKKTPLQKIAIIFAGPFMNFILAILIFACINFFSGIPVNKIGSIIDNTPAQSSALKVGDEIVDISGNKISSWTDIPNILSNKITDENIIITYKRDGKLLKENIKLSTDNGNKILGISPAYEKGKLSSVPIAVSQTYNISVQMLKFVGQLINGEADFNNVSGPIGIVRAVSTASSRGFGDVVMLAAIISLNLGIINILPFPALDGGRIVFSLIEILIHKKISIKIESMVNYAGLAILVALMIYVSYRDILKLM